MSNLKAGARWLYNRSNKVLALHVCGCEKLAKLSVQRTFGLLTLCLWGAREILPMTALPSLDGHLTLVGVREPPGLCGSLLNGFGTSCLWRCEKEPGLVLTPPNGLVTPCLLGCENEATTKCNRPEGLLTLCLRRCENRLRASRRQSRSGHLLLYEERKAAPQTHAIIPVRCQAFIPAR